jgi:hypothetical protein
MQNAPTHHKDYCNIQNKFCTTSIWQGQEVAECLKNATGSVTNRVVQFHTLLTIVLLQSKPISSWNLSIMRPLNVRTF